MIRTPCDTNQIKSLFGLHLANGPYVLHALPKATSYTIETRNYRQYRGSKNCS